ncbi:WecB/TagA/CpsF family glycosyltransferase [Roseobacter sp. YSTF-M11]|uniref:WecB/TagA/CpsF family glycosyltransferase n=1 Tax=Roseobacter insulae TaxID=2859783 RepID=A0A9X1K5F0_9RHOB|nr:WecB/TagA/CpsF family glycosyltransferase [Roseobacter insulae]MBW4710787.1 WecB/TagA/CpsF family glycosyltransferase [Roseobacter insulae]
MPLPSTQKAVRVNVASRDLLLEDIAAHLQAGRGFTVATLNLDHVTKLRKSADFRQAYLHHSHVTADGNPIVWFSRLAGHEVDLVPGSELIDPLAGLAARHNAPVAVLGATEPSLKAATDVLRARYPDLQVAALIAPPMGFDPTGAGAQDCIETLERSGARLCFLALGAPKQEIFAAHASAALPGMGFISIGAGLDFISGQQQRAPRIVRRLAGEWLWRLALNPRRLARRYGACIAILPGLLHRAIRARSGKTALWE